MFMQKRESENPSTSRVGENVVFLIFADVADVQIPHLRQFMRNQQTLRSAWLLFEDGVDKERLARLLIELRKCNPHYHFEVRTGLSVAEMLAEEEKLLDRGIRVYDSDF